MPAKPTKSVKAQPYPYEIPSIEYLKEKLLQNLDPWKVQDFLKIEALLRSKKVAKLYKETFSSKKPGILQTDSLYMNYFVYPGWGVLKGFHHRLIMCDKMLKFIMKDQPYYDSGVIDLRTTLCKALPERKEMFLQSLKKMMHSDDPKNLFLEIDATYPTRDILNALRKLIAQQKEQIKNTPDDSPWFRPRLIKANLSQGNKPKHVLKLDAKTWIDYFRCYDLHRNEGRSYGRIAIQVYDDSKKEDLAKKAYKRVHKLICYAETNNWPPPANFLNK